ncbi:hypothetical protein B0J14DRAFT_690239 [Halenospora varia]|nr:hypothetical protein B0J14DRAFT_690239 [Halenospora varia]
MYNMLEDPFLAPANMTSQYSGSGLSTGRAVPRSTQSGPMPNHMDAPPALGTAAPPASEIDDDGDSIISWETEELDTINSDSLSDDEPLMTQVRRSKPNQAQAPPAPTVSAQESQAGRQVGTNSGGQGFSSQETVNPSVSVNQVPSKEDTNRPRYFSQPNDLPHMVHCPMQSGPSYGQQSNMYPMTSNHYHFPPTASTQVPHPLFQQIGVNSSMGPINAPTPGIYNQPGPASFGSSHRSLASGFPGGLTSQGFPLNQNFPGRIPQLVQEPACRLTQEPALQLTAPYDGTVRNFTLEFQRVGQTLAASGHIVSISLEEFQLLNDNLSTFNHYPLNSGDVPLALIKFDALKTMLISEMKLDINKVRLLYRPGTSASGFHEQSGVLDCLIHSDISLRHAVRACRNANRGVLKVWVKAI